ncbi:hypothetical protein LR814_07520 [Furfurilactobacillus rossiae]|nr:hypothetical protein LR814_07520 [Furfurilactobacillus rossiae]
MNIERIFNKIFNHCVDTSVSVLLRGYMMPDYVHLLVSILPKLSVSSFMGI